MVDCGCRCLLLFVVVVVVVVVAVCCLLFVVVDCGCCCLLLLLSLLYDMYLHNETLSMLDDALLLVQAAEDFLHLDPASAPQPASDVPDSTGGLASEPTAAPAVPHRQLPPTDPWG